MNKLKRIYLFLKENPIIFVGAIIIAFILVIALLSPYISPYDPREQSIIKRLSPPSLKHFFGMDHYGRDIFTRVLWGARTSLTIAICSIFLGGSVGTILGTLAGYKGGQWDNVITRLTDILMSFPTLIFGIIIIVALGPNWINTIYAIAITMVPHFIRFSRGPTLSVKESDFIQATKALGASDWKIIIKHILPNILGPVVVMATFYLANAIIIESALSFLGIGVQPPRASWGRMIFAGLDYLSVSPWLTIFPGLAILITSLGFNLVGDGIRDILDPKIKQMR
jgi:peptide/nickel transport system permease protein